MSRIFSHLAIVSAVALVGGLTGCGAGAANTTTKAATSTAAASSSSASSTSESTPSTSEQESSTSDSPTSAEAPQDLKLGSPITVTGTSDGESFKLTVTLAGPKLSKAALSDFGDKPKGSYVGYQVTYACDSGKCDYNSFDWTVRSEDGEEADASFLDSFEPGLQSGTLRAGRKAKGYITYDLKPGTYYIEYSASFLDDDSASWKHVLK